MAPSENMKAALRRPFEKTIQSMVSFPAVPAAA
jgi:hypothetical protein